MVEQAAHDSSDECSNHSSLTILQKKKGISKPMHKKEICSGTGKLIIYTKS